MKKTISLLVVLLLLISCNQNDSSPLANERELNQIFLKPRVNTVYNEKYNILFNSNTLNGDEIKYLKDNKLSKIITEKFNKIRGFTIYYENANPKLTDKQSTENDIIAISIYAINSKDEIVHNFYLKNHQKFEKKFSLLENVMDTSNQIFLVSLYAPNLFFKNTIGISNFCDLQEATKDKNNLQRNEFNLFKVVKIHEIKSKLGKSDYSRVVDPKGCEGCAEQNSGTCDAGLYCNAGDGGMCEAEDEKLDMVERGVITQSSADIIFNNQLYYDLRDNLMTQHSMGQKYIDYYYALSGFLQASDYDLTTLYKMMTTLPELNTSLEKLLSNSNNSEIIISEQFKTDMLSIINDLKPVSQNPDYLTILTELENDVIFLSNKTKSTVINDLQ